MNLTVLGSNAGGPSRTNAASGYLVESGGVTVWMDAGTGTFMRLAELMDPADLDAVVVSHVHVDHCADVFGLYAYLANSLGGSTTVPVYGPHGVRDLMASFARADVDHVFHRVLDFREAVPGEEVGVGHLAIGFGQAVHPVPAVVTKFSDGTSTLVYSGDTGPGGGLIPMATMCDLLLCEAAIQGVRVPDTYPFHMTAREAGEVAAASGANRLVLTHIPRQLDPQLSIDQASSAYVGDIAYAAPGSTFTTEE